MLANHANLKKMAEKLNQVNSFREHHLWRESRVKTIVALGMHRQLEVQLMLNRLRSVAAWTKGDAGIGLFTTCSVRL